MGRNKQIAVYCIAEIVCEKPLEFDLFKIGVASDPRKRLASLQTGNPRRLALIIVDWFRTRGDALFVERRAHDHIKEHARVGEWFAFNGGEGGCPFEAMAIAASPLRYGPASDLYYDYDSDQYLLKQPTHYNEVAARPQFMGAVQ